MIPNKIEDIFIQVKTDLTGAIIEIEAGKFAIKEFTLRESIFNSCPFLENILEFLPLKEVFTLNTMVLVSDSKEYNIDIELTRKVNETSILIHNRTNIYKNIIQLNQNRNDLFLMKRELVKKNEELKILRNIADKANEGKSRFLAIMSHEVRNPLNSILGYSEMISVESTDLEISRYAKSLTRAGKNLRVIVDDILDFSRIEAGKLELIEESMSLDKVVKSCVDDFCFQQADSKLEIKFIESDRLEYFVYGDNVRITQILSNLINNAIKFTKKGIVSVGIDIITENKKNITARICVMDTGRGMNFEQSKKIFNEYEQNETKDQRISGGAGLGLSIVKLLVETMEGNISVESTLNVGTKFVIDIPFKKVENIEKIEKLIIKNNNFSIKGKEILLADDDLLNQTNVTFLLNKEGCVATVVGDGIEALELLQKKHFDFIILDINMPRMTGEELVENSHLFAEFNKKTPILALTGNTGKTNQERYLSLGFNFVLSKPYTSVTLIDTIKTAIFNT